jgi:hypothetical protein
MIEKMANGNPNPDQDYLGQAFTDLGVKIRDLEERQRIMKDRLLLIGKNLIEIRGKTNEEIVELKKENELLKSDVKRLMSFLESASSEFTKFARKDDLEILYKQAKMFQPLRGLK